MLRAAGSFFYRRIGNVDVKELAVGFGCLQWTLVHYSRLNLPAVYIRIEGADAQIPPERRHRTTNLWKP